MCRNITANYRISETTTITITLIFQKTAYKRNKLKNE